MHSSRSLCHPAQMKVIRCFISGDRAVDIAHDMVLSPTTVRILKLAKKIRTAGQNVTPLIATKVTHSGSSAMERLVCVD